MREVKEIWDELEKDTMVPIYSTPKSRYTIFNGYKIEKSNEGKVTIHNTRHDTAFYLRLGQREKFIFATNGFVKGTHLLAIDHLRTRLEILNETIQYLLSNNKLDTLEKVRVERRELIDKLRLHFYKIKIKNET